MHITVAANILLYLFITVISGVNIIPPIADYLDRYCGMTVRLGHSKLLRLTMSDFQYEQTCTVRLEADEGYRILIKFYEISMSCKDHGLQIHDGTSMPDFSFGQVTPPPGEGVSSQILSTCGYTIPKSEYKSFGRYLLVRYNSTTSTERASFKILFTQYFTGTTEYCNIFTYSCDNARCISPELVCDGYDNCGDNSDDYKGCLTYGGKIGVGFAVTVIGVCAIVIPISIWLCRRTGRCGGTKRYGRSAPSSSVSKDGLVSIDQSMSSDRTPHRYREEIPPPYEQQQVRENSPQQRAPQQFEHYPQPKAQTHDVGQVAPRKFPNQQPAQHYPQHRDMHGNSSQSSTPAMSVNGQGQGELFTYSKVETTF